MRVVTTCHKEGLEEYGQRWLDGRKFWPKGTEFHWYTEGYELPLQPDEQQSVEVLGTDGGSLIVRKDFSTLPDFVAWKARHKNFVPPDWRFDVVKFSHKVFAAIDALEDYDGIGVWLDADCVTFRDIPEDLLPRLLGDAYIAHFGRTGMYTETGFWMVNCAHPAHKDFLAFMREVYLTDSYVALQQWHDCLVLDAAIRRFVKEGRITATNLSGSHEKEMHPQALTELGGYFDHCKGPRKRRGVSGENRQRKEFEAANA